jgi:hypothetical protein
MINRFLQETACSDEKAIRFSTLEAVCNKGGRLIAGLEGEVRFGSRRALPRPIESE